MWVRVRVQGGRLSCTCGLWAGLEPRLLLLLLLLLCCAAAAYVTAAELLLLLLLRMHDGMQPQRVAQRGHCGPQLLFMHCAGPQRQAQR